MSERNRGAKRPQALAERDERALHAYHDGELRGFARWRFERRLARRPALRRELQALSELGALLREQAAAAAGPELWDRIALRLPAEDARRGAAAEQRVTLAISAGSIRWARRPPRGWSRRWLRSSGPPSPPRRAPGWCGGWTAAGAA
jgi:anti-sigma factor RsiW